MKHVLLAMGMVALLGLMLPAAGADEPSTAAQAALAAMHDSLVLQNGEPTAELMKLVAASENETSAESNTLILLEMVSLLEARVASGAATSAEGVTTVTLTPRPIKLVMVQEGGAWKVDLKATLAGLPEGTRQAIAKLGTEQELTQEPPPGTPVAQEAPAAVGEVTDKTFEAQVTKSQGWVLVDFWEDGCGWCDMLAPVLKALAPQYAGKPRFLALNSGKSPQTTAAYNVNGFPTMVIFQNGLVAGRHEGYLAAGPLKAWIDGVLKGTAAPTDDR